MSGKNGRLGSTADSSAYGQSDVMTLMDIPADDNHVNVISFPRDLLVDVPACMQPFALLLASSPDIPSAVAVAAPGLALPLLAFSFAFDVVVLNRLRYEAPEEPVRPTTDSDNGKQAQASRKLRWRHSSNARFGTPKSMHTHTTRLELWKTCLIEGE
ncbi:hypothetical protein [Paenarthrobacter nicotinovorans]|uniref:hypothetical protein n=1 Tax=Paenarthrobacter nicotinovorans TaxID=29320 RepID=UPI00119EECF9|nr:hypothetical protein [Paenarthrobacter nicotinovorans]